jgi:hypothetical protein
MKRLMAVMVIASGVALSGCAGMDMRSVADLSAIAMDGYKTRLQYKADLRAQDTTRDIYRYQFNSYPYKVPQAFPQIRLGF